MMQLLGEVEDEGFEWPKGFNAGALTKCLHYARWLVPSAKGLSNSAKNNMIVIKRECNNRALSFVLNVVKTSDPSHLAYIHSLVLDVRWSCMSSHWWVSSCRWRGVSDFEDAHCVIVILVHYFLSCNNVRAQDTYTNIWLLVPNIKDSARDGVRTAEHVWMILVAFDKLGYLSVVTLLVDSVPCFLFWKQ